MSYKLNYIIQVVRPKLIQDGTWKHDVELITPDKQRAADISVAATVRNSFAAYEKVAKTKGIENYFKM